MLNAVTFGQSAKHKPDLTSWDSLHLRHEQTLNFYNNYIDSRLFKSDTLIRKDSIIISNFSKEALVLQRIIRSHRNVSYGDDSIKCVEDVREEFYNSKGLIAYVRNYHQPCFIEFDSKNEDMFFTYYYERFEYDEHDNLIVRVFNISTPITVKETYLNENGEWTKKRQKINETEFWK